MYTAICILLAAIALGRLLRSITPLWLIRHCIIFSVWLLLFLMGVAIGSDEALLGRLPSLGWQAIALMAFSVAGSIACSILITPLLKKKRAPGAHNQ